MVKVQSPEGKLSWVLSSEFHLEVSGGQWLSNQRMHSNHWGSLFKIHIPGPHPRGFYSLGLVWDPGICMSPIDMRLITLWVPCGSHMERPHRTRARRTRVSLCSSPVFGSEYILSTIVSRYSGVWCIWDHLLSGFTNWEDTGIERGPEGLADRAGIGRATRLTLA